MSRLRSALLTLGAVAGTLCLLVAIAGLALGVKPLIFRSGSMAPDIPAGALAFAYPEEASDLEVGDVVSVLTAEGARVTHRVVAIAGEGDERRLTLQGDANPAPDEEIYGVTEVDRVFWSIPYAGHVVAFVGSNLGLFLLGGFVFAMLVVIFRPGRPKGGKRRATAMVAASTAAVIATTTAGTGTSAAFTDTAAASSGTLTAHTVIPPASASCSAALLTATVSWPNDTRYDYEVVLRRVSNSAVVSTTQVTGGTSDISYAGLVSFGLVAGAGTVDFQVEIRSYLTNTTSWRSASVRTYQYIRVFAIVIGATVSCTT